MTRSIHCTSDFSIPKASKEWYTHALTRREHPPKITPVQAEAVELIAAGKAPRIVQPEEGATYEPYITAKPELAQVKLQSVMRENAERLIACAGL